MLLVGDVGGTKTDLAVVSYQTDPRQPVAQAEFKSAGYSSLVTMVREFLSTTALSVDRAVFDVAGPVFDGRAKVTNLPWVLDQAELARELKFKSVHLLKTTKHNKFA